MDAETAMIDQRLVEKVAHLARIEVPKERLDALVNEMAAIIGYVDQLRALDVSAVPPLTHASHDANVYRDDVPGTPLPVEEALRRAPDRQGDFYRVPKVIGEA